MSEVPNAMNAADELPAYYDYGITPEQYHAGVDQLWNSLNGNANGADDVFSMCADRLKKLESALRPFANFACSEINSCTCNNCTARDLLAT